MTVCVYSCPQPYLLPFSMLWFQFIELTAAPLKCHLIFIFLPLLRPQSGEILFIDHRL